MLSKTLPVKIKLYGLYRLPFRWRDDCKPQYIVVGNQGVNTQTMASETHKRLN